MTGQRSPRFGTKIHPKTIRELNSKKVRCLPCLNKCQINPKKEK